MVCFSVVIQMSTKLLDKLCKQVGYTRKHILMRWIYEVFVFISIASLCTSSQNLHVSENASPPLLGYVPNKMQFKEYVMKHRNCLFGILKNL